MRLLELLFSSKNQPSRNPTVHQERFSAPSRELFPTPILARMDVRQGSAPLVKFAGTFWRFRVCGAEPDAFVDGQKVKIVGRQGNCLLIELETSND